MYAGNLIRFLYRLNIEVLAMITPELIARINELARKQREGVLTAAEKNRASQLATHLHRRHQVPNRSLP